jgi:serine/threonine-protein kinase
MESGRRLDELSQIGLERRRDRENRPQRDQSERRLVALLDAYGQALETMEVEAALESMFFSAGTATEALERATRLLVPQDRIAPSPAVRTAAVEKPDYSVAVLPFADLSPEADQEYFANGLSEELISALTKIRGLRVIARSSAFSFRGEDREPSEIGSRLRVDALIRGSVRKAGERLRVTVQLVDTSEGRLLWSERYDGEMGDVFSIQDQLAASLIDHLSADLSTVPAQLTSGRTADVEAYHFYLRGRHLWNKRTPADLRDSLHYFEEAIGRDQSYALAYAGLADSYNLLGYYSILAPKKTFPKARVAAQQALEIDDTLAEAHCSLAFVMLLHDWDWRGAEREFRRTLELNPGYATAHHWFAEHLTLTGRQDEAVTQAAAALKLDPVAPIIHVLVGWVYYYARRYDEAMDALEAALLLDPGFAPAEFWLGLTHEQKGRHEEARAAFERAISGSDRSPMMLAALARLHAERGEVAKADTLLEELRATAQGAYVPAYYMAAVYSGYSDREQALEWLETSLRDRESWMVFLNVDPIWDPFRRQPRFEALVEAVGLEGEVGHGG